MLLGKVEVGVIMIVGSENEGFDTVDLTYKGGEHFFGAALPTVGAGTREASVVDVTFLLCLTLSSR